MAVVPRNVLVGRVYVAQTQSSQAVNIQARVSGFLERRTYVEDSVVKAGQVLFQMDRKPFQAELDAATAALQRNQAALEVARANLARTKPLAEQNALSQKDLDDAQGQFEQSAAAVEQSKAQVELAKLNLSYTTIASPVTGVSSFAAVADGTYLDAKNAQLTTVSVLTPMWINFSLSENEMERLAATGVRAGRHTAAPIAPSGSRQPAHRAEDGCGQAPVKIGQVFPIRREPSHEPDRPRRAVPRRNRGNPPRHSRAPRTRL